MKSVSLTIRKKKHKRQIGALWLFLIVLELFCPVLCEEPISAVADVFDAPVSIFSNYPKAIKASSKATTNSVSASDLQAQNEQHTLCNDECLCHAVAIPGNNISSYRESVINHEQIAFSFDEFVDSSLSPPHQPPKIS